MLEEEVISKSDLIYVTYGESEILKQSSAFRQQHISRFIQRRLDYFFVSNLLQVSVIKTDALAAFSTDHLPLLFSLDLC